MKLFCRIFGAALLLPVQASAQPSGDTMAVPSDYRQWVFLTSSLDLNYDMAAAPGHHMLDNVFVDPKAFQSS